MNKPRDLELAGREALRLGDRAAHRLERNTVALTYRVTARRTGQTERHRALVSSVYVQRGAGWRLALHQQTPLPARPCAD